MIQSTNLKLFFLLTHLGTKVFVSAAGKRLEHNFNSLAAHPIMVLVGNDRATFVTRRAVNPFYGLLGEDEALGAQDLAPFCETELVKLENDLYAFRRAELHLSADLDGKADFVAREVKAWEQFRLSSFKDLAENSWAPPSASGGTQIVGGEVRKWLGPAIDNIQLAINQFSLDSIDGRPLVVWIHNETSSNYDWLNDIAKVQAVSAFVFVSNWQRQSFFEKYSLPIERCIVLRNAISIDDGREPRELGPRGWRVRCAYTSAPYRGLEVLLDAWEMIRPDNAELHIWSSKRLWGPDWKDSDWEESLFQRAKSLNNVFYHGIAPNAVIRAALEQMDILAYPSVFLETSCIAIIEAMASGLRVVAPSLAVIPETSAGFGRIYPYTTDKEIHARIFASILFAEICDLWSGNSELMLAQQSYAKSVYSWGTRRKEWLGLIKSLT
jgi:glycosyltransferase involved in cell wall biosynthesis